MCRNCHKTTFSVKLDLKYDLSVPDFLYDEKILEFQVFLVNFLLHMYINGHKTTSGQIFNPKFETPMVCILFDYEFWWRLLQDECRCGLTMRFLYVCPSVCLSNACIVTKRKKDMFRFLYHTKEHLS